MTEKVFQIIDEKAPEYYDFLEEICNIESNSADFEGVRRVNDAICEKAEKLGFTVRKEEFEGAGVVALITLNEDAAKDAMMYSGHMDTVYQRGAFGNPPVHRDGDTIYGPGVADCKGGIAVAMLAMDALKTAGYTERPVKLFLQCDEEVGSRYSGKKSINTMIREASKCAAFLNCENSRPGYVTTRRKGILGMTIRVHGVGCHAKDYREGASAVVEAAYKITRIHEQNAKGSMTYNCTLPLATETPSNVVPDVCDIRIDIRVETEAERKEASAFIHQVAEECTVQGTWGEVTKEGGRPPMEKSERNEKLFEKMNRVCEKNGWPVYLPFLSAGGADAANVSQAGVPSLDSLGIEGEDYHSVRERARLSSMPERAKVLAAITIDFDNV